MQRSQASSRNSQTLAQGTNVQTGPPGESQQVPMQKLSRGAAPSYSSATPGPVAPAAPVAQSMQCPTPQGLMGMPMAMVGAFPAGMVTGEASAQVSMPSMAPGQVASSNNGGRFCYDGAPPQGLMPNTWYIPTCPPNTSDREAAQHGALQNMHTIPHPMAPMMVPMPMQMPMPCFDSSQTGDGSSSGAAPAPRLGPAFRPQSANAAPPGAMVPPTGMMPSVPLRPQVDAEDQTTSFRPDVGFFAGYPMASAERPQMPWEAMAAMQQHHQQQQQQQQQPGFWQTGGERHGIPNVQPTAAPGAPPRRQHHRRKGGDEVRRMESVGNPSASSGATAASHSAASGSNNATPYRTSMNNPRRGGHQHQNGQMGRGGTAPHERSERETGREHHNAARRSELRCARHEARAAARVAAAAAARVAAASDAQGSEHGERPHDLVLNQEWLLMEALACTFQEGLPPELAAEGLMNRFVEQPDHGDMSLDRLIRRGNSGAQADRQHAGMDELYLSTLPVSGWMGSSSGNQEECPLCLCEYEVGEQVMRLPCLHHGHEECMSKCLLRNRLCPVCKIDVQESVAEMFND